MLKTKEEIKAWLDEYWIEHYTINDDLTVDVDGDVDLDSEKLTEIPVQFGRVNGAFLCCSNSLTSLSGIPKIIEDGFVCLDNPLENELNLNKSIVGQSIIKGEFYSDHFTYEECLKYVQAKELAEELEKSLTKNKAEPRSKPKRFKI